MRYRARLIYDGTRYHGYQRQANASPTVQEEVEAALAAVCGEQIGVLAAGRTDAGVHATGQVIAFDVLWKHQAEALRNALNANLPDDTAVNDLRETTPDFHPRYDARWRSYEYALYVSTVRDPLRRHRAWHLINPLNVDAIREAVAELVGQMDYATFGTPPQGESTVRAIKRVQWDETDGDHLFTITGNAFLYRMVRSIVGTLVMVGQGRMTVSAFRDILSARDRQQSGPAAPAYGLTLTAVDYG